MLGGSTLCFPNPNLGQGFSRSSDTSWEARGGKLLGGCWSHSYLMPSLSPSPTVGCCCLGLGTVLALTFSRASGFSVSVLIVKWGIGVDGRKEDEEKERTESGCSDKILRPPL